MDQSGKSQILKNGRNSLTVGKPSLLPKFFIVVGSASLLAGIFVLCRNIILVLYMLSLKRWDNPSSFLSYLPASNVLFYLPAGVILLIAHQAYRKSRMPNWQLGGAIGFALYVSLHWLADLGTELHIPNIFALPLFLAFEVANLLWGPIFHYILISLGSVSGWIDTLGTSFFAALPFVILGIVYANAKKRSWQSGVLAVIVSLFFIFLCLYVLWFMLLLAFVA